MHRSSTNPVVLRVSLWPSTVRLIPVRLFDCRILVIIVSIAMIKSNGASGHPCLMPEDTGNQSDSNQLTVKHAVVLW